MNGKAHVYELLERLRPEFPSSPKVNRFEVQEDNDSIGDPSLFIWVLFDDATEESEQTSSKVRPIEEMIKDSLREIGETRWPYVRFRTESEYDEIINAWK